MIILTSSTDTLSLTTSEANVVNIRVDYVDNTSATYVPSFNNVNISSITNTVLLTGVDDHQLGIKQISAYCVGTNTLTFINNISVIITLSLNAGDTLFYEDARGWYLLRNGAIVSIGLTGSTTIGTIDSQTKSANGLVISGTNLFAQTADATFPGLVSAGSQTIAGAKTLINNLSFDIATASPKIIQTDNITNSATAQPLTIQAQNATGTTTIGGNLILTSGTGTTIDGYVKFQRGGTDIASLVPNKFAFNKGQRRNITNISSVGGTYTILTSDDIISITTLSSSFTINLPASPIIGDQYVIKDMTGNASGSLIITVSGNGNNIDSASSVNLVAPGASITIIYNGSNWGVI